DTPYSDELYNIMGMAASPDGDIYGMDMMSHLLKFDKETGVATDLGEVPEILMNFVSSAVWNNDTNKMLVLSSGFQKPTTYLYELDVNTLEYTLLTSFPNAENYTALYRPANYITNGCPEAITDFSAVFENGSRTGKLTFTCPKYNIGSDMDGMGALEYRVVRRGSVIASGTAPYGQKVEIPFTADENGTYQFSVYTVNGRGESARTPLKVFIGKDKPAAPVVTATLVDRQHVNVSWEPVTVGSDGGYINPAKVKYTCYRKPDNKLICQDAEGTSFVDEITWPEGENAVASYTYEVYARAEDVYTSATSTSNKIMVGGYVPTFREDFSSGRYYDEVNKVYCFSWQSTWTIIDANADGKSWEPVNPTAGLCAGCYNDRTTEMDDWLISPPLFLDAGKTYQFSFKCGNRYDTDRLEVLLGNDNVVDAFTQTLISAFNVKDTKDKTSKSCDITVSESGIYFIGFHGISVGNTLYLTVTDVEILAGAGDTAPGMVTDFSVIPDSDYANKAVISFTTPKFDAEGNILEGVLSATIKRNGVTVKTFEDLTPGQSVEYTDAPESHGTYNYDVATSNANGQGATSTIEVYVGVRRPLQPQEITAKEGDTDGEVVLSWVAPATDVQSRPLADHHLTYDIVYADQNGNTGTLVENYAGNNYTYTAADPNAAQKFMSYAIYARTAAGRSNVPTQSNEVPVGLAYMAPYNESFSGSALTVPMGRSNGGAVWDIYDDTSIEDLASQDNDGAYCSLYGTMIGLQGNIYTAKINLADLNEPILSFWVNCLDFLSRNILTIEVGVKGDFEIVETIECVFEDPAWNKIEIDLEDFAGKVIQLRFTGEIVDRTLIPIDNISIYDARPQGVTSAEIATVESIEYYDITGNRVANPSSGIFIKISHLNDGTIVAEKIYR
ncbi:MAG: choice-of-anchor J domain-containing protein, partial [Muribaculaceae bacterium]